MDKENKEINAVHERDLDVLLQRFGIKEKLEKGEVKCKFCRQQITKENLYSVLPESGAISCICDKPECVVALTGYVAEKNINKVE